MHIPAGSLHRNSRDRVPRSEILTSATHVLFKPVVDRFMPLNLIKLCVGAESLEDLEQWIAQRTARAKQAGVEPEHAHTTRMMPKRRDELLDGGSLYWVIKGNVQARQRLLDVRPFTDSAGISRCDLVMEQIVRPTQWQPKRTFQGWRYFRTEDVPADLTEDTQALKDMPDAMRTELLELGLL